MAEEIKTRDELMADAERWINKGIKLEADGKSEKMVSMCIDKAIGFEDAYILEVESQDEARTMVY